MDLVIRPDGRARWHDLEMQCALGRSGIGGKKGEGDGLTPAGRYRLRRVLYRPDRGGRPDTGLRRDPIAPGDAWCDSPGDRRYNQAVGLPYRASAETLWREDCCYDLLAVIGYNDDPVIRGLGSGIFLHVARGRYEPTEGCVGLSLADLKTVLARWRPEDRILIEPA